MEMLNYAYKGGSKTFIINYSNKISENEFIVQNIPKLSMCLLYNVYVSRYLFNRFFPPYREKNLLIDYTKKGLYYNTYVYTFLCRALERKEER